MKLIVRSILLVALALLLVSCGDDPAQPDITVSMLDNSYDQESYRVPVGGTVRFTNDGRNPHNAFDTGDSWSTQDATGGVLMLAGDTADMTFDEAGTYEFFCTIHATEQDDGTYQGMVATLIVGDGADDGSDARESSGIPDDWTGTTRDVPNAYPTIQSAVDAADPGDLVLIAPGVYREAVEVTTPSLTIRGTDRNEVILDGEFTRENGIAITADGVAVENLTARNYTVNGFFWNGVSGYRGSYLTSIDNWVYGLYAFDSVDGLFEHSYASGSWDAGFYIGQCRPCDAVITDVVAEYNGLGYSGTNASGNLWIVNSEWRHNGSGIGPNSLDSELLPPTADVVVAGNYAHNNGDPAAAHGDREWGLSGNGIILIGTRDSVVRNNLLVNNETSGVLIVPSMDRNIWLSGGNRVTDNVALGSGRSDYALSGFVEQGSCFADNVGTHEPWVTRFLHDCDGIAITSLWNTAPASLVMGRLAEAEYGLDPQIEHGDAPKPTGEMAELPGGATAEVRPAVGVFESLDFDPAAISTPELPADVEAAEREPVFLGVVLTAGAWPVTFGVLLSMIPKLAWLVITAWALWNIWRRSERSRGGRIVWTVAVVAVPLFGALAYLAFGARTERRLRRVGTVFGGLFGWLALVVGAFFAAGLI